MIEIVILVACVTIPIWVYNQYQERVRVTRLPEDGEAVMAWYSDTPEVRYYGFYDARSQGVTARQNYPLRGFDYIEPIKKSEIPDWMRESRVLWE